MKKIIVAGMALLVIITLFAMPASPLTAGFFAWTPLGRLAETPPDPYVSAIVADPARPDILFAGTLLTVENASLVYRSDDGGKSWVAAAEGLPGSLPAFTGVKDLLALPGPNGAIYAGLDSGGVWRNEDGGERWEDVSGGSVGDGDTVLALAAVPGRYAVLYALTPSGVHVSTNGGPWISRSTGLPQPGTAVFNDLAIDPADPNILYVATNPTGLFRSTNAATDWVAANGDMPNGPRNVRGLAVSPHSGEVFISLRGTGLLRSADGGESWTPTHEGITYNTTLFGNVGAPIFSPGDPDMAYTFNSDGIFRSEDGGATWMAYAEGLTGEETITTLAFNIARPHTAYAGTSISGVWDLTLAPGGQYFVPIIGK